MTPINVDKSEDDGTIFEGSLNEDVRRATNVDESESEDKPERITSKLPGDFETLLHQPSGILENTRASLRDRLY